MKNLIAKNQGTENKGYDGCMDFFKWGERCIGPLHFYEKADIIKNSGRSLKIRRTHGSCQIPVTRFSSFFSMFEQIMQNPRFLLENLLKILYFQGIFEKYVKFFRSHQALQIFSCPEFLFCIIFTNIFLFISMMCD